MRPFCYTKLEICDYLCNFRITPAYLATSSRRTSIYLYTRALQPRAPFPSDLQIAGY
jgi:hypothetical protein